MKFKDMQDEQITLFCKWIMDNSNYKFCFTNGHFIVNDVSFDTTESVWKTLFN